MGTKGSIIVGGKKYIVFYDAYPQFAGKILRQAVKLAKTRTQFVRIANKLAKKAGYHSNWIIGLAPKSFGWPSEEYRWYINLKTKKVTYTRPLPKTKEDWKLYHKMYPLYKI